MALNTNVVRLFPFKVSTLDELYYMAINNNGFCENDNIKRKFILDNLSIDLFTKEYLMKIIDDKYKPIINQEYNMYMAYIGEYDVKILSYDDTVRIIDENQNQLNEYIQQNKKIYSSILNMLY